MTDQPDTERVGLADRLIGYAVHDDTCTANRFPGQGVCSCGLSSLVDEARTSALRQPVAGVSVEEIADPIMDAMRQYASISRELRSEQGHLIAGEAAQAIIDRLQGRGVG